MKHTIGEEIKIYGTKTVKIIKTDEEKGMYLYGDNRFPDVITEQELLFSYGDYVVEGKQLGQIEAFYPVNLLYNNNPAVYLKTPTGSGYRVDTHRIRHATLEEVDRFHLEKETSLWGEYGREIGEFGPGDIIRYEKNLCEIEHIENQEIRINTPTGIKMVTKENLEMVAISLDRFDKKEEKGAF